MDEVSAELESLIKALRQNETVLKELENAAGIVERAYSTFENADYSISVDPSSLTLSATGEGVGFAEFGTGVYASPNDMSSQAGYAVYPGSYSESEGTGQFASKGYWYFDGKRYYGQAGTNGMQQAKDYLEQALGGAAIINA